MEKSYRRALSKSKRPYRHLKLVDCRHALVLQVLSKFSSNLNSLTLSCDVKLEQLAEIIQLCPNIQSLDIKFSNFEKISQESVDLRPLVNLEILRVDISFLNLPGINLSQLAPNVTSLTIVYSEDLAVPAPVLDYYGPRLRQLILLVNFCLKRETKVHNVWQTKFPLLQRFECHLGRSDDPYDPITDMDRILEPCGQLQVAKFYRVTYLPRLTLKLSQLCTNLRELSLGMIRVTAQHFVHICQLQQLKYLHIEESTVETPNFQCYQVLDSLTELSLHAAYIADSVQFNDFARHAFPALSSLRVHNCRDLFYIAEIKFCGLQLLEQLSVREIVSPKLNFAPFLILIKLPLSTGPNLLGIHRKSVLPPAPAHRHPRLQQLPRIHSRPRSPRRFHQHPNALPLGGTEGCRPEPAGVVLPEPSAAQTAPPNRMYGGRHPEGPKTRAGVLL